MTISFSIWGAGFTSGKALQVAKVLNDLWAAGSRAAFLSVDFHLAIAALKRQVASSYRQVVLKRVMYRVAEQLASRLESKVLVAGDSIGQVTSQSLQNIKVIDEATALPVFRPLIGQDKEEIIRAARHIGTALLSEKVVELCGISRGQPVVNAKHRKVLAMERALAEGEDFERKICEDYHRIDLDGVNGNSLRSPYLFADDFDPEAQVVDCQEEVRWRLWSVPHALHIPYDQLLQNYRSLDKSQKYILYCTYGSQTPLSGRDHATIGL